MRIAANREGIGSRLKCLLSVMRMASMNGESYRIKFDHNKNVRCNWNDLFLNNIETKESVKKLEYPNIFCSWKWDSTKEERLKYNTKYFDYMFSETPFKKDILYHISKLNLVKYCEDAIKNYNKKIDSNTVSVCVRTWADVFGTKLQRDFNINKYFSLIDKEPEDKKIFLTSDIGKTLVLFQMRYGKERILYFPKRTQWGDFSTVEGMQDTMVELYLSGRANKMYIAWHSAFTECQWWFGGAKAEVIEVNKWK